MLAVQGDSHERPEPCCFHEKEETGPTQIQLSAAAHGHVWAGGHPIETSLTMKDLPNDLHTYDFPLSKGSASSLIFLSLVSVVLRQWGSVKESESQLFAHCFFLHHSLSFRCLTCITYFSSYGCLTCHVWFEREVVKFGRRMMWRFHLSIFESIEASR